MGDIRSVSQKNQYDRCAYQYYLERIEKVWVKPAAWLPQGTAVHLAVEEYEKSGRTMPLEEAQEVYSKSYDAETNRYLDKTPNMDFWFASGPYKGQEDIERRYGLGMEQVGRYYDWVEKAPEQVIWIDPDGTPAIELSFVVDLDGVKVRGYIDQVVEIPSLPQPHVRDVKSGNKPGDDFQLATYAVAVNKMHGTEITTGDYWMGRQGKPTKSMYYLESWTEEKVTAEFHRIDEGIKAGNFPADPEPSKCNFCSVRDACKFAA